MNTANPVSHQVRQRWRLFLAAVLPGPIAGMFAALVMSVTVFASLQVYNPVHVEGEVTAFLGLHGVLFFGAFTGATWGLIPMILIGLPAHAWLIHRNRRSFWPYGLAASLAGLLFGAFMGSPALATTMPDRWQMFAWYLATGACCGIIAGLTFWLIRRPDRDAVSASPTP